MTKAEKVKAAAPIAAAIIDRMRWKNEDGSHNWDAAADTAMRIVERMLTGPGGGGGGEEETNDADNSQPLLRVVGIKE